jgi:hypothetical protein
VAIPVKNGADYLAEAIESVLAQESVELSVHVVDNLSDDDSVAIARSYEADPRLRVEVNDRDVKYYGSLNRALAEADTDYFVPFAADDLMYPGNLALKLEALEASGAGFAHSTAARIDEAGASDGLLFDHSGTPALVEPPHFFPRIAPNNCVSCQAVVARTGALRELGGFDGRSVFAGDWLTWLRLSLRWRVATLPDPLVANRVHAATGTATYSGIGVNGRDIPATLDRVFLDERMPPEWAALRDSLVAESLNGVALTLHRDGIQRVAQGFAGYMMMGRRAARLPDQPLAFEQYRQLVQAAGLVPPSLPVEGAAEAPRSDEDARALRATVDELGQLLARLLIAAPADSVDEAMERLDPLFGDIALDVALIPSADPLEVVAPGRVALARWGSELVGAAEARGVPVYPYAIPDPFAEPPNPVLWETVDPAGCLP